MFRCLLMLNVDESECLLVADQIQLEYITEPSCRIFANKLINRHWHLNIDNLALAKYFIQSIDDFYDWENVIICAATQHGNFPSIEYVSYGLRQQGKKVIGIYLLNEPPSMTFDRAFSCQGSLELFGEILKRLPPLTIYLQAHAKWSFLSQFIKAVNPNLKVFQEVYDWMDFFIHPENEAVFINNGMFSFDEIKLMRVSEQYIRSQLNGFIYKDGGYAVRKMLSNSVVPSVQLMPCPPKSWCLSPNLTPIRLTKNWRLVYAGQVKSAHISHALLGDMYYIPLIRDLTQQNIDVSVYSSYVDSQKMLNTVFGDYIEESRRNSHFHFYKGIPVRQLLRELHNHHHFGLLLYYFNDELEVGENHLHSTLPSKLFTYLTAGLPVLISEELVYAASIVEQHKLGLVLARSDIPHLHKRLASLNYTKLLNNVRQAQEQYYIERFLPPLFDLLLGEDQGIAVTKNVF